MKISSRLPIKITRLNQRWPFGTRSFSSSSYLPEVIHPVLILPGILGTWPPAPAPTGRLDPISRTYASLTEGLNQLGYRSGEAVFGFPYDWRRSVTELAEVLRAEVSRIKKLPSKTLPGGTRLDYSRVDLVGHSMGGVVARAYVQSDNYADDVARLLLVATPQKGALAAYYAYEGGDSTRIGIPIEGARSMVALSKAREMRLYRRAHRVYRTLRGRDLPDLYDYLHSELHSIQDFLPLHGHNYLYRLTEDGQEEIYPFGYPHNDPLEIVHRPDHLDRLDRVSEIACFYSTSLPTMTRLQVEEGQHPPLYQHGQPLADQPAANYEPGDTVVSLTSGQLVLPPTRSDGQPWRVRVRNEDLSVALGQRIDHVQIVADPAPVRYLLDNFTRADAPALTAAFWDGPVIAARRPNYAALII